jgi:selenide, water dikinase
MSDKIKLTQYSHGAGCGCKIAPSILDKILATNNPTKKFEKLMVGNESKDDAAVYDLGNGQALISTTDFFMPIVDDPFEFGAIASANAISDVYAMGGSPIMAIAILGWPINIISEDIAQQVLEGSRSVCDRAGIPLAGGHSIDAPEPIFGLAVSGTVDVNHVKKNTSAKNGDALFLTKPLGVGILTTAEKKSLLKAEHQGLASRQMMMLNDIGPKVAKLNGVNSITDVTGFGLLGHLLEMCEGSNLSAEVNYESIPLICNGLEDYININSVPGGSLRNWASYGHKVDIFTSKTDVAKTILSDPQTSGGLLISVDPDTVLDVIEVFKKAGLDNHIQPIGKLIKPKTNPMIFVK